MKTTFDMDALRTMVVGVELGNFARAATQLGRSQSAVSMQLKKLEQQADRPLFRRNGRSLVPTEAGDALLEYARRIIALNDEAAASLGTTAAASLRIGMPQDFVEDVIPDVIVRFARQWPGVHVEVRAGRNYTFEEEVRTGRLDVAFGFFSPGPDLPGDRIVSLPMIWISGKAIVRLPADDPIPLVLFDHLCVFRQAAFQALERKVRRWRLALTTPSLPGVWAALRAAQGISVRTAHRLPSGIRDIGAEFGLPKLPATEVRMLAASELSPAASDLRDIISSVLSKRVAAPRTQRAVTG